MQGGGGDEVLVQVEVAPPSQSQSQATKDDTPHARTPPTQPWPASQTPREEEELPPRLRWRGDGALDDGIASSDE